MIHRGFRPSLMPLLIVAVLALGAALLAACGGDDDDQAPTDDATTAPAGESPTDAAGASPTDATTLPEITSLCDLVTAEDVEEALGESATLAAEFKDVSCAYSTASGGLNIERGSQQDFEVGIARTGDVGELVPGIGDEAAWFVGGQNTLIVRQGDFYFQLRMNLPELDSATQLEAAKDIAARAVERIP